MTATKSGGGGALALQQTPIMESSDDGEEFTARFQHPAAAAAAASKPPTSRNVSVLAFGVARHTLGMCLLLVVVVLWTGSNFLASVRICRYGCLFVSVQLTRRFATP
jgi:hypothetical protein